MSKELEPIEALDKLLDYFISEVGVEKDKSE